MDVDPLVVSTAVVQVVTWPLAVLLGVRLVADVRAGRPAAALPRVATALLLAGTALLVLAVPDDPLWLSHAWFVLLPVLCATYPDGRWVPRWLTVPALVLVAVPVADVVLDGRLSASPAWSAFASSELLLLLAQVHRYRRRATTAERLAARWALLGLVVQPVVFVVIALAFGRIGEGSSAEEALAVLALLPVPVACAVGLLRPEAVDVDRLLHWVLAAVVVAVPASSVAAVVLRVAADDVATGLAVVAAVAVTAAVLAPAARAAGWVVHGGRVDPAAAVRDLAARFDAEPDPTAVPQAFLAAVVAGTRCEGAALEGVGILSASTGKDASGGERVPVTYLGTVLADLLVLPRRGETALTRRDRAVVAALALHGAAALHGAVVLADLVDARSRLVRVHEEERRRLRHDLHDDLGPALAGLSLGAAALARRAGTDDVLRAAADELADDIRGVVGQARELAHGLRPAVLDDHGLVAAVRSRVGAGDGPPVVVDAPDERPDLPAAVDLAALRIVTEAVENVRRHARARRCVVRLAVADGSLLVEVEDDGVGLPDVVRPGLGLASIRDRAGELGGDVHLARPAAGGLRVVVRLPLAGVPA